MDAQLLIGHQRRDDILVGPAGEPPFRRIHDAGMRALPVVENIHPVGIRSPDTWVSAPLINVQNPSLG